MANEFYINRDILVRFYVPENNGAVWGAFLWDGAKWGSSTSYVWENVVAEVTNATITNGSSVQDGFSAPLEPNTMSVSMQSTTYDPFNNYNVRSGTTIGMWYRPNPDTAPSVYTCLFIGKVDTLEVSYDPITSLNTIDITAVSSARDFLNKVLPVWNTTGKTTRGDQLTHLSTLTGFPITDASFGYDYTYATEYKNDITVGDVLEGLTTTERALVIQQQDNDIVNLQNWNAISAVIAGRTPPDGTPSLTFSNTHSSAESHGCISEIGLTYDGNQIYNVIKTSLDIVPSTTGTRRLTESIALFGEHSTERVLHVADATQMNNWLANYPDSYTGRRVSSITTPAIKRDKKLARLDWMQPLDVVGVNVVRSGYTVNEVDMITKATHEITPDNWFVTLELWKGF